MNKIRIPSLDGVTIGNDVEVGVHDIYREAQREILFRKNM